VIDKNRMVFFNIAWMREYKGNWTVDVPVNGGSFIRQNGWGGEVYNFQPYNGMLYGYVEPGAVARGGRQRRINITRLVRGRTSIRNSPYLSGVLVVWVATPKGGRQPLLVGWYENATLYRDAQIPPLGSGRQLPNHNNPGEFFASAAEQDGVLIPPEDRAVQLPRKGEGIGRSNLWYAQTDIGEVARDKVLEYIRSWKHSHDAYHGFTTV